MQHLRSQEAEGVGALGHAEQACTGDSRASKLVHAANAGSWLRGCQVTAQNHRATTETVVVAQLSQRTCLKHRQMRARTHIVVLPLMVVGEPGALPPTLDGLHTMEWAEGESKTTVLMK